MSKSNPVRLWRFGRTGALIFTQKWPNRAKTGVPKNTKKNLWGPTWGVLVIQKIQLTQNNWKIKFIFYGLATRELYFLKKKDTKWPFPPSSGNWPICVGTCSVLKCWQMSNFTSAFGLEFINSRFGSLFRLPRVPIRSLLYLLYWSWVPISKLAGFRNRGMWGPGDLKGPFLSIVTPIEEKNANYSQITYACQDFWFIKSFIQFLLAK